MPEQARKMSEIMKEMSMAARVPPRRRGEETGHERNRSDEPAGRAANGGVAQPAGLRCRPAAALCRGLCRRPPPQGQYRANVSAAGTGFVFAVAGVGTFVDLLRMGGALYDSTDPNENVYTPDDFAAVQ